MALIDKETIRAEIERRMTENCALAEKADCFGQRAVEDNDLLAFLDTLPESAKRGYKDCNGCEYNRTIKDQIGWQFRGCFGGEYKGKPIAEIELCPLKVDTLPEQPAEGLEEEMEKFFETMPVLEHENIFEDTFQNIARHFAEWGAEHLKK